MRTLKTAILAAQALLTHAIPQFNFGKSSLDAEALQMLSSAPLTLAEAMRDLSGAARCICNGCYLHDVDQMRFAYGDLHMVGAGIFVLNATMKGGETDWDWGLIPTPTARIVRLFPGDGIFERRGVLVFAAQPDAMNDALARYVGEQVE